MRQQPVPTDEAKGVVPANIFGEHLMGSVLAPELGWQLVQCSDTTRANKIQEQSAMSCPSQTRWWMDCELVEDEATRA